MAVPYTFASATGSIPLSQLDTNFATAIVIGNTSVYLGNTITTLNNITLANATISSVVFASGASLANVTLTGTTTVTGNITTSGNSTVAGNLSLTSGVITSPSSVPIIFLNVSTEAARVDVNGNWLVGRTSITSYQSGVKGSTLNSLGQGIFECDYNSGPGITQNIFNAGSNNANNMYFYRNSIAAGVIVTNSSAQTSYAASSDYRLKNDPQPLIGSGTFIDALHPRTWIWASSGLRGVGFIAHEVATVSPSSVFGEKDAVNKNNEPIYQSMEYGSPEFIANIIAELQSLRARVATLEAKP